MLGTDRDLVFSAGAVFVACLPILLRLLENIHRSRSLVLFSLGVIVHVYSAHIHNPMFEESEESAACSSKRIFLFNKHKLGLGAKPTLCIRN